MAAFSSGSAVVQAKQHYFNTELLQQFDLNIGFTIPAASNFFGDGESSEYSLSRSDMSHEGMRSSAAACSDHDSVRGGGLSADGSDVDDESEDHAYDRSALSAQPFVNSARLLCGLCGHVVTAW